MITSTIVFKAKRQKLNTPFKIIGMGAIVAKTSWSNTGFYAIR
jgi:hypothetical protein